MADDEPSPMTDLTNHPEGEQVHDQLRVWSLFTGVGGFDLGLERAGAKIVLQCEQNPWRRRVLQKHWPQVPVLEDVRDVRGIPGAADILCGGFPCQDLSVAGKRAGLDGDRSGLFFEFARIADELELADRGGWVWLENVPGLLSSNGGRDFGIVLQTLADLGFAVAYRVLDSRYFGVPQRRRRVFIVGHSRADYARAVLFDGESSQGSSEPGGTSGTEVAGTLGGGSGKRGWCDDFDRGGGGGHTSLSGLGSGGVDDNDAQAGRLIVPPPKAFHQTQDPISSEEWSPAMGAERAGAIGVLTSGVAHTLTSEGMDASEDGTGRGTPIIAAPLTSGSHPNSNMAGRRQEDDVNLVVHDEPMFFSENQRAEVLETTYARQLTTGGGKPGQGYPAARIGDMVRRLTPTECERLQGFPDGHTAVDGPPVYAQAKGGSWRCKEGTPDSQRYAAMGDAVTVNVIEWIAERLINTNHRRET